MGMFDLAGVPSDHWAAVEAIGAGRRAAVSIHQIMDKKEPNGPERDIGREKAWIDVDELDRLASVEPRGLMPQAAPSDRTDPDRETALGYQEAQARTEADRCLNCGLICYDRVSYPPLITLEEIMGVHA
jgi:hypothetical protein